MAGTFKGCEGTITLRRICDLCSTFASHALAAGVSVFELAKIMGTSVRMIDATYGHLAPNAIAAAADRLDAHIAASS